MSRVCSCADPECRISGCKAERPLTGRDVFRPTPYMPTPAEKFDRDTQFGNTTTKLSDHDVNRIADKVVEKMKEFFSGR